MQKCRFNNNKKEDCEKPFLLLHLASDLFKMNGLKRLSSLYKATSSIRTGRKRILDPSPLSSRLWRKMGSQPKEKQLSHPSVCASNLWLAAQRICTQMPIKKKRKLENNTHRQVSLAKLSGIFNLASIQLDTRKGGV